MYSDMAATIGPMARSRATGMQAGMARRPRTTAGTRAGSTLLVLAACFQLAASTLVLDSIFSLNEDGRVRKLVNGDARRRRLVEVQDPRSPEFDGTRRNLVITLATIMGVT
jgi:hypothetical protein